MADTDLAGTDLVMAMVGILAPVGAILAAILHTDMAAILHTDTVELWDILHGAAMATDLGAAMVEQAAMVAMEAMELETTTEHPLLLGETRNKLPNLLKA